jgi:hypothetical protein
MWKENGMGIILGVITLMSFLQLVPKGFSCLCLRGYVDEDNCLCALSYLDFGLSNTILNEYMCQIVVGLTKMLLISLQLS